MVSDRGFDRIFDIVIMDHEGGSKDNAKDMHHDKGGLTRYGISQFWKDKIDIENCTEQEAKDFYKKYFLSRIETKYDGLTLFLFDSLVQHDSDACIWLQEAIGLKGKQVDGIIGSGTRKQLDKAINLVSGGERTIVQRIAELRMQHYMDLDDTYAKRYHKGWSRRFIDVLYKSLDMAVPF